MCERLKLNSKLNELSSIKLIYLFFLTGILSLEPLFFLPSKKAQPISPCKGLFVCLKWAAGILYRSICRHSVASKKRTVKMKTLLESTSLALKLLFNEDVIFLQCEFST